MMTKEITIYADYVCPYCLLAEKIIADLEAEEDIAIRWRPFELRPEPVPTLRVEDPYLPTVWAKSVYPMAAQLGVTIRLPSTSPQPRTAKAFEAFAFAEAWGRGHAFSVRVMRAFFQEDRNIGDPAVLADLAADIGLDGQALLDDLASGTYRQAHADALRHATEAARVTAVPTIVVGSRRFHGVPSPDSLKRALDALA